MKISISKI